MHTVPRPQRIRVNAVKVFVHKFIFINTDLNVGVYLYTRQAHEFYLSPLNWLTLTMTLAIHPDSEPEYTESTGLRVYAPISYDKPDGAIISSNQGRYAQEYTDVKYDTEKDLFLLVF